jgi:hypothetical protein
VAHIITTMILSWKELCFFHQDMKKKLRKKIISSAIEKKGKLEKKGITSPFATDEAKRVHGCISW